MARWGKKTSGPTGSSAAVRTVGQLREVEQQAWPAVLAAVEQALVSVAVLPADARRGEEALHRLQVSTGSTLGALAVHCGGLLVDNGWLRILGSGSGELPDLASANSLPPAAQGSPPPHLVVAYDVLGGVFAVDGGGLGVAPGEVCYCGPDTLVWDTMGVGHSAFVHGALSGALGDFFSTLRWPHWEHEVAALQPWQGLSLYPPPFTAQGQDLAAASRRAVPLQELVGFYEDAATQLAGTPDGQPFTLRVTE